MLFAFVFAFLLQVTTLADVCPAFGVPVTGGGYDGAFAEVTVTDTSAILNLPAGNSFWLGYERGGFAPAYFESDPALTLTLWTADGGERWLDITEHAGVYYVLAYANTQAYADANGEHMGTHPCAAFVLTGDEYADLVAALEEQ